jgi:hypothetical protein
MLCPCAEVPLDPVFRRPSDLHRAARNLLKAIELGVLKEETGNVQLEQIAQPLPEGATWPNDILVKTLRCLRCGRRLQLFADTYHGGGSLTEATAR